MLRLIDVFMDSGPQVLLQLYVITTQILNDNVKTGNTTVLPMTWSAFVDQENRLFLKQVVSIASSLFSMGYALAGYHRCLRNQQYLFCVNKSKRLIKPISWYSTIMQFVWYLFLISPRVLSMALFASTFRSWFFIIIFIHWLIMYFWILNLKTNYCITSGREYNAREEIFEKFYNFVCSFIYIFAYFNLKSGKTRYKYLTYYIIFYLENILFSISYYCFSNEKNTFFKVSMLLIILIGFWIAILFQILYYLYFHPAQDIRLCVKIQNKFHFIHVTSLVGSTRHNKNKQRAKNVVEVPQVSTSSSLENEIVVDYKALKLNQQKTSSSRVPSPIYSDCGDESETTRSFKSLNVYQSRRGSSLASIVSSSYHSISNRKPQSLYGSCLTLKDDHAGNDDDNDDESTNLKKLKIEMLNIKETSL